MQLYTNKYYKSDEVEVIDVKKFKYLEDEDVYVVETKNNKEFCLAKIDKFAYLLAQNKFVVAIALITIFTMFYWSFLWTLLIFAPLSAWLWYRYKNNKLKITYRVYENMLKVFILLSLILIFYVLIGITSSGIFSFKLSTVMVLIYFMFASVLLFTREYVRYKDMFVLCNEYPGDGFLIQLNAFFFKPPRFVYWN